jgi:hypothetical protein
MSCLKSLNITSLRTHAKHSLNNTTRRAAAVWGWKGSEDKTYN